MNTCGRGGEGQLSRSGHCELWKWKQYLLLQGHLGGGQFICLQPYFFFFNILLSIYLFIYLMILENSFSKSKGCIAL